MSKTKQRILLFIGGLITSYLIVSYVMGDFNPNHLAMEAKVIQIVLFGCIQMCGNFIITAN